MKKLTLLLLMSFTIAQLLAQTAKLTGKVVDAATNEPLVGVTVLVKATKKGASTAVNGTYTINAKEGDALEVSYIGYNTIETKASNNALIKLTATAGSNLQDVVVVGYGTQKRANLTAAVATVKGDQLIQRPVSNTSMALQGFVAGLTVRQGSGQPGADGGQFNIRGIGSVNSVNAPLIIIDGVEGASINDVDPNVIESVSVLKDAASAAVYGVRGTNGVILVTTKRGQKGKTSVAFNSFVTSQQPTNMPETLGAIDDMLLRNEAVANTGSTTLPFSQTIIDFYRNNAPNNYSVFNTDWQNLLFQNTGLMQNHNIIVSGGGEKSSFLASGTYLNQQGLIVNNQFKKWDLRLNGDVNITNKIKFTTDLFYTKASNLTPAGAAPVTIIQRGITMARHFPGKFDNGTYGDAGQSNSLNPVALAESSGTSFTETPTLSIRFGIKAELFKGFVFDAAYTSVSSYTTSVRGSRTYEVYSPSTNGNFNLVANNIGGDSSVSVNDSRNNTNQYYASGTYSFKIFREHNIKVQAGLQAIDNLNENNSATRFGWQYFDRPYLNLATGGQQPQVGGGAVENSLFGVFSRINYDFRDKYLFELTGRYDGSSRFSRKTENQYGIFPSASAGWVISKENFFKNVPVINYAKLRVSYGALGNQGLTGTGIDPNYPFIATLNSGTAYYFNGTLVRGFSLNNIPNVNISWETSVQSNIGIDLGLLKNKLNITFDYYEKRVNDMIINRPNLNLQGFAGGGNNDVPFNGGSMINKGWEFSATYKDKIGKDFTYRITGNLSDVTNMVTNTLGRDIVTSAGLIAREGFPINSYQLFRTNGLYQRGEVFNRPVNTTRFTDAGDIKFVDIDGNDTINAFDRQLMGNNFPRYEYSLDLYAAYKGFDLSIFIYGVGKRDNYISGVGVEPFNAGNWIASGLSTTLDRWTPNNPNAKYPRLYSGGNGNYTGSDFWLRNGAFMRVKHITLGYNLPKKILDKANMQQCRIYVNVVNPFTFSNYEPGFDPEPSNQNGSFYPIMRTFTAGFNIKF
jgi:TonB-linked SusC/RagA family outer membrane protein